MFGQSQTDSKQQAQTPTRPKKSCADPGLLRRLGIDPGEYNGSTPRSEMPRHSPRNWFNESRENRKARDEAKASRSKNADDTIAKNRKAVVQAKRAAGNAHQEPPKTHQEANDFSEKKMAQSPSLRNRNPKASSKKNTSDDSKESRSKAALDTRASKRKLKVRTKRSEPAVDISGTQRQHQEEIDELDDIEKEVKSTFDDAPFGE